MPYITSVERLATQRGMEQGIAQGIEQGIAQGIELGIELGLQQSTERGVRIGAAKVIERLLARRFGPLTAETRARLQTSTLEQLDRWADRLLDAATLDEVFSDS